MTTKQRDDMPLHEKDNPSSAGRNEKNDDAPQTQEANTNTNRAAQKQSEALTKEGVSSGAQQQSPESSQVASRTVSAPLSSTQEPSNRYGS
jgi:hypothetical protein